MKRMLETADREGKLPGSSGEERASPSTQSWRGRVRRVFRSYFPRAWRDESCILEGCACRPSDDALDGYCSAYCAAAARDVDEGACACGHEECNEAQLSAEHVAADESRISIGG